MSFQHISPMFSKNTSSFQNLGKSYFYSFTHNLLYKKYSQNEFNYIYINTTYLIFNEKCRIVSIFKDYLIYDDSTEFLRRFYNKNEIIERLNKIYNFYETYSKIFPNYMILPENLYLYRNIRKKQKMIDAFNEIKREEEENRKNLKLGISSNKKKVNYLKIFDKNIEESINRYQPSISNTFIINKNSLNESKSSLSISLYNKPINNYLETPNESFKEEFNNTTIKSIDSIIGKLDKNYNNLFQKEIISTPKRELSNNKQSHINQQNALNNNKKFISHKVAVSVEITKLKNNNEKKNNIKNIYIEKNNINNNHIFKEITVNFENKSPEIKSNRGKNENKINKYNKHENRKNKQNKNYFMKEVRTSEYKSPNSNNLTNNSLKNKRPITTTIKTTNHMMPIYKNKFIEIKNSNCNNSDTLNTISSFANKVNPLKTKLEKKKNNNVKKHNTLNISNKKTFISSFTFNNPKEIKKTLLNEVNNNNNNNKNDYTNNYNNDSNQNSNNNQKDSSTTVNTGNENLNNNINNKINIIDNNKMTINDTNNININDNNKVNINDNLNINNSKDMKDKYKNFVEKNKIIRNSYEPQSKIFHRFHTQNNVSVNTNKNINLKSQRKIKNMKNSNERKIITSPNIRFPLTNIQNKNKNENNYNNHIYTPVNKSIKLNLNLKDKVDKFEKDKNNKNSINNMNFKIIDGNTKKMKFVKK